MEEYNFLKECKVFFVLTTTDKTPQGRPFGAIMENNGRLYISTSKKKDVYSQIINNNKIQIVAIKPNSRDWVRINALANECNLSNIKSKMLISCPELNKHFKNHLDENFAVFELNIINSKIYS